MSDIVLTSAISALISTFVLIIKMIYDANQEKIRQRNSFLRENLKQLAILYGDARKFLYLEDASSFSDEREHKKAIGDFSKTIATFEGIAQSINDSKINELLPILWIERKDNKERGKIQEALRTIIARIGSLITPFEDDKKDRP